MARRMSLDALTRAVSMGTAAAILGAVSMWPSVAHARKEMTRQQIADLAWPALGHGYKWGGDSWTDDRSRMGQCVDLPGDPPGEEGCPTCSFPADKVGADCSGYVTKAWQIPQPLPVDKSTDTSHPYNANTYYGATTEWQRISFNDLRKGDAIASTKHIRLFINQEDGTYRVWEAKGCRWGIVESMTNHDIHADDSTAAEGPDSHGKTVTWHALRRLDLVEQVTCATLNYCNGHGTCDEANGTCACKPGFVTPVDPDRFREACSRCAEGYYGYPACTRAGSACKLEAELVCGSPAFTVKPTVDGAALLTDYGGKCTSAGADAEELTYRFQPTGTGWATVTLKHGGSLKLLRGACAAAACIAEGTDSVRFEYGGEEAFFIVVESKGSSSALEMRLACETGVGEWIGDPCDSDADCDDMLKPSGSDKGTPLAGGYCYRSQGNGAPGFCSRPCSASKPCPERVERAPTFCVAAPEDSSKGMCVSRSANQNQYCRTVPGTGASSKPTFGGTQQATVCYPGSSSDCQGEMNGQVVDYSTGAPIGDAHVELSGAGLTSPVELVIDSGGNYHEAGVTCGDYTLTVSADGYLTETVSVTVNGSRPTQVTRLRALAGGACDQQSTLTGTVFDGTSDGRTLVPGTVVDLYRGVDTTYGKPVASAVTDEDGVFSFADLEPGNYTATTTADGYDSSPANVIACGGGDSPTPTPDIPVLPSEPGSMRIVLEWERPDDLDLHLQLPNGNEVHFYDPCRTLSGATLQVDRITAEGPEVIAIDRFGPGQYTVFVHNYSAERDGAEGFELSNARVTIQGPDGEEIGRFNVPTTGGGFFWDVVTFQGSDPQTLFPLQHITSRPNPYDEYTEDCRP